MAGGLALAGCTTDGSEGSNGADSDPGESPLGIESTPTESTETVAPTETDASTETNTPTETTTETETATATPDTSFRKRGGVNGPGYTGFEHTATLTVTNEGPDAGRFGYRYRLAVPGKETKSGSIYDLLEAGESTTWEKTVVPSRSGDVVFTVDGESVGTVAVGPVIGGIDPDRNPPASVTFPESNTVTIEAIGRGTSLRYGYGGNETARAAEGKQFLGVSFRFASTGGKRPLGMPYRHMWRLSAAGETYEPISLSDSHVTEYYGFIEGKKYKSAPQSAGDSRTGVVLFELPASVEVPDVRIAVDWGWSYMANDVHLVFRGERHSA